MRLFAWLSALAVGLLCAALYLLTKDDSQQDPCLTPQSDVSAAILAGEDEQDALANRAMLQRKLCEQRPPDAKPE